jgi:hypothetical protein
MEATMFEGLMMTALNIMEDISEDNLVAIDNELISITSKEKINFSKLEGISKRLKEILVDNKKLNPDTREFIETIVDGLQSSQNSDELIKISDELHKFVEKRFRFKPSVPAFSV